MKASQQSQAQGNKVETPNTERTSAVYRELESYVSCIRDGKKAAVDAQVGRNAALTVLTANRAMEEGRVIKF
jgi:predicted dehydrogenase